MKKMKKIFAALLTLAMVLGMSMTTFAAEIPDEDDYTTGHVQNVEYNANVNAYQIVKANYNDYGFIGYSAVTEVEDMIANPLSPTADEVAEIAKSSSILTALNHEKMTTTATSGLGEFTADLEPGYWLVLVDGGKEVYNPMLLGVYYTKGGSDNTLKDDPVSADDNWSVNSQIVYAKSSKIPITKTADKETQNLGGIIKFTIETEVPYYSNEYTTSSLQFKVTDSLTNLAMLIDTSHAVAVEARTGDAEYAAVDSDDYTNTAVDDATTFEVSFDSEWIKSHGGYDVRITYYATLEEGALNTTPGSNDATVTYTNDPSNKTNFNKDTEKIYTFDIDGEITADIIKKVKPGTEEGTTEPLQNATFTLYTDETCKTVYTNLKHAQGTAISDAQGQIEFTGLAAGTYYLKETAAPEGYSLNNTVYKIDIVATIANEELTAWTVTVEPIDNDPETNAVNNTFTVSGGTVTPDKTTTQIMNTTLSELPSTGGIGTTIFTIGGCIIMIAAAGLFFASRRKESK